jgi:hypothetical protein
MRLPIAYLCGLGSMGQRHLVGLARAGFQVIGQDPKESAFEAAKAALEAAGLDSGLLQKGPCPPRVAVALFCETADRRLDNVEQFLASRDASRLLLEKPLTADPRELGRYRSLAALRPGIQVNLPLRALPFFRRLSPLALESSSVTMTLNGGAKGLGGNGIHYLDLFLSLTAEGGAAVPWCRLDEEALPSPRGAQFEDFGGDFLVENPRGRLYASLTASSSAAPVLTVRGDHFLAVFDEGTQSFHLRRRRQHSVRPASDYGRDYEPVAEGPMTGVDHPSLTEQWAKGTLALPTLQQAVAAHELLFEILGSGGAARPYRFT